MQKPFSRELPKNGLHIVVYDAFDGILGAAIYDPIESAYEPIKWLSPTICNNERTRINKDWFWLQIPPLKI